MRYIFIFLVFGCLCRMDVFGQTEEDSVKIAVNRLFIAMKNSDARGLKVLEIENTKLKKLLAEAMLDNVMLKDIAAKK